MKIFLSETETNRQLEPGKIPAVLTLNLGNKHSCAGFSEEDYCSKQHIQKILFVLSDVF